MKIMADLHLGLDENEADIAEELQDFDDSFDTRSEASSSDSAPSISSVSSVPSSIADSKRSNKNTSPEPGSKGKSDKEKKNISPSKRSISPVINGENKKKRKNDDNTNDETEEINKKQENKKPKRISESAADSSANLNSSGGNNISGSKSDISDTEAKMPPPPTFDSDSSDSDSDGGNIKRNGRKNSNVKSSSPARKSPTNTPKTYDYMTKINYLFRDTRFFLIKSNNAENINLAKTKNCWATLPQNDINLNQAFKEARNVLLIFSVNESGRFAGYARMSAHSRRDIPQVDWVLPPTMSAKALGGVIELDWICRKELPFSSTSHLYNSWNDSKPVKIGRDGQEIEPKTGADLCRLFPEDDKVELTPILRKSKETAKLMREKGIRVIYKAPRSLSSRGGRHSGGYHRHNDRRDAPGPMRHKRYGPPAHRPYKMSHHLSYKRGGSPYRSGPPGSSRGASSDAGMPPWERYMSSAAAAEAYVADYMRTMGQLPPLPFVPPFGPLPLPAAGPGGPSGPPPSIYEQLPPPVRYYDGPPLPDYPPPQPLRPPPPGFDKPPTYEDFAAWKNAGLPTVPNNLPPGFGGYSGSSANGSTSGGGASAAAGGFSGGGGGSSTSGGNNSYRNRSSNSGSSNSALNRSRDRIPSGGGRDYHRVGTSSRGGNERDRFRSERGGGGGSSRNYREGVRR